MKVLHVVGSLDKKAGGPSRSVPQSCEELVRLGVEIDLVARPSDDPVEVGANGELSVTFRSIWGLIRYGLTLKRSSYSLIHLQHVWDPYIHIMARIARWKGIPYLITPRGMLEPWIMNRNKRKKKLGLLFYQRKDLDKAASIHATSSMEKSNVEKLGIETPVHVVPNGVVMGKFPKGRTQSDKSTKKLLFLSRIDPKKGIEFLIEAWSQLPESSRTGWRVDIIGNGEAQYISHIEKEIDSRDLGHQIKVHKPVFGEEKLRAFREASLFVLPTHSENFGIVVAESLACYTPVITTTGTPWEILNDKEAGWCIDIGVKPLKKALEHALTLSDSELDRMGLNGRHLVEEEYNMKFVAQGLKTIYDQISSQAE